MENLTHCLGTIDEMDRFGTLYGDGEDLIQHRGYWLPETYPGSYTSEGRANLWKFHPRGIMVFDAATMTVETFEVFNFKMTPEGVEAAGREYARMWSIQFNGRDNEFKYGEPPLELFEYGRNFELYRLFCDSPLDNFMRDKWKIKFVVDMWGTWECDL